MAALRSLFLVALLTAPLFAQEEAAPGVEPSTKRTAVTIGLLQGGGALIGADFEIMATDRIGFQVGAGLFAYGAAFNIHLHPWARSNFISLGFWNQGFGDNFAQSMVGVTHVWRGKKWFTAQLGGGVRTAMGDKLKGTPFENVPFMLLYSIGGYF